MRRERGNSSSGASPAKVRKQEKSPAAVGAANGAECNRAAIASTAESYQNADSKATRKRVSPGKKLWIYDGRTQLGAIIARGGRFLAFVDRRRLGAFANYALAKDAILATRGGVHA